MVTVNFKLTEADAVRLNVEPPRELDTVLQQCAEMAGVELGGYMAVRDGQVITADTHVGGDDNIDVFPAISGG